MCMWSVTLTEHVEKCAVILKNAQKLTNDRPLFRPLLAVEYKWVQIYALHFSFHITKIHDHKSVSRDRCYYQTSVTVFQICLCPGLSVGIKQLDIVSSQWSLISPNVMYRRISVLLFFNLGYLCSLKDSSVVERQMLKFTHCKRVDCLHF